MTDFVVFPVELWPTPQLHVRLSRSMLFGIFRIENLLRDRSANRSLKTDIAKSAFL